jgi:putative ABC transport system permease protein
LSTTVGVILSLTLILTSWGMVDTVEILLDRQFEVIQLQDAQIYFDPTAEGTLEALEDTEGIERAEPVAQTSILVEANGEQYATELIAFDPDTEMHDFGTAGPLGAGLVVGRSLAGILGIDIGDDVRLIAGGGAGSLVLPIDGFVDEPLGTFVYGDRADVRTLTDTSLTRSAMVTFADDVERNAMRRTLTDLPGVLAYADSQALYDTAQSLLSLFYAFVGVMLAFGALMAFALIFNTATVNAAERSAELAAMKVNGVSSGQIARLMAAENLLLTIVSILPGLAIGYGVSAVFMDTFSSDLFDFGLQMRGRTLLLSALAIVVVSAVAQWPTKRAIDSLDVARVVRERSQ